MRSAAWLFVAACSYAPEPGAPIDTPVDVATFDPVRDCPVEYAITLAGQTGSRYRMITNGRKAWEHSDDCNDDRPGSTHLVAIDDPAELDQVETAVTNTGNLNNNKAWVGGVQLRDQITAGVGWLLITGGPLLTSEWDKGEPNDGGSVEDNGENFVGVERGRAGLVDFPSNGDQGGMCECDGKPVDQTAFVTVDTNRE